MNQRVKVFKESKRKHPWVEVDGHKYTLSKRNNKTINWQCSITFGKRCCGTVTTTRDEEDAQLIREPHGHDICHLKTTHGPSQKSLRSKNKCKPPSTKIIFSPTPDQRSNRQEDSISKLGHPAASKILSSPSDQSGISNIKLTPAHSSKKPNSVTSSISTISPSPSFSQYSEDPNTIAYNMQEQPTESSKKHKGGIFHLQFNQTAGAGTGKNAAAGGIGPTNINF